MVAAEVCLEPFVNTFEPVTTGPAVLVGPISDSDGKGPLGVFEADMHRCGRELYYYLINLQLACVAFSID